jgi:hypothetical protein
LVIDLKLPDGTPGSVTYLLTSNTLNGKVEAVNIPVDEIRREFTRQLKAGVLHILGGSYPIGPAEGYLECVTEALFNLKRRWPKFRITSAIPRVQDRDPKGMIH